MLSFLMDFFKSVKGFKSDLAHQADCTFYVVCRHFDEAAWLQSNGVRILRRTFAVLMSAKETEAQFPSCKHFLQGEYSEEREKRVYDLLDVVDKLRAIGQASRKISKSKYEAKKAVHPCSIAENVVCLAPVVPGTHFRQWQNAFNIFGPVAYVSFYPR